MGQADGGWAEVGWADGEWAAVAQADGGHHGYGCCPSAREEGFQIFMYFVHYNHLSRLQIDRKIGREYIDFEFLIEM